MFHRSFFQRLVPFLTAYLLLVSLGLPLQRIYCACIGEQWLSLTVTGHQCHQAEAEQKDPHEPSSCCQLLAAANEQATAEAPHDCGDSEILLAQLDADFLPEQEQATVSFHGDVELPVQEKIVNRLPNLERSISIRGPTPPPLLAGKDLLIAQQTFLI